MSQGPGEIHTVENPIKGTHNTFPYYCLSYIYLYLLSNIVYLLFCLDSVFKGCILILSLTKLCSSSAQTTSASISVKARVEVKYQCLSCAITNISSCLLFVYRSAVRWWWPCSCTFLPPITTGSWWRACTSTASFSWRSSQTESICGDLLWLAGVSSASFTFCAHVIKIWLVDLITCKFESDLEYLFFWWFN